MHLQQMGKGRAAQESAVELDPVGAPWAGYRETWGVQSWRGESQSPWLCTVLSGQIRSAFAAPAPGARGYQWL